MSDPHLPYAGTSGWSGSDTSRDRALQADASGETRRRQHLLLAALEEAEDEGLTVVEVRRIFDWHHGVASSVLSVLHKAGDIERLQGKRDKAKIYVLPHHVAGRITEPFGRRSPLQIVLETWLSQDSAGYSLADASPAGFVRAVRSVTGIGL